MERKIGEIFEYNGEWYQAIEQSGKTCKDCYFYPDDGCFIQSGIGWCSYHSRNDNKDVIFKKLEKFGEPYVAYGKVRQKYKLHSPLTITNEIIDKDISCDDVNGIVDIEIKQTKEDIEEKKLNLKPFDLQKAKAGKPVCTRDGRKARIICFDKQEGFPIIALVETKVNDRILEEIALFNINGRAVSDEIDSKLDLIMLPEKKEGWINVYALNTCYPSKEEAEANIDKDYENEYVRTIKIEWEE